MTSRIHLTVAMSLFALGACAEERAAAPSLRDGPLYLVSNTLAVSDSVSSYVTVVDSLAAGQTLETSRSLEFPGSARAYGLERAGVAYLTSSEQPTMTEVTVDAKGVPSAGRMLSFSRLGIDSTSGGNVHLHISPTKAYFVSQQSLEIVVWNPQEMAIIRTIPLELELPEQYPDAYFYPRPILVGERLLLLTNLSGEISGPGVIVSVVDTKTDRVESSQLEPRCHSFLVSGLDADGDRYFASSDYAAAEHWLLPEQVPAPCMLRIRAGETAFDPEWSRTLSNALGTQLWTGVTQGANGKVYVQGTDQETAAVRAAAEMGAYEVTVAQAWDWYTLRSADSKPERADTGLEYPPSFAPFNVDEHAYVAVFDDVDTTLVDLSAGDRPEPGLVVPGFVYNVVRVH